MRYHWQLHPVGKGTFRIVEELIYFVLHMNLITFTFTYLIILLGWFWGVGSCLCLSVCVLLGILPVVDS